MYHSLLVALVLVCRVMADSPVTPTTTPNPNPPANVTATPIKVKCNSVYVAFSEQELAELAAGDSSTNSTSAADISKLSPVKQAVFCQDGDLGALCAINSCQGAFPVCQDCVEFTPNADTNGGTLGTVVTSQVTCADNYNFNVSVTQTSYLCGIPGKEYSCKSCTAARDCTQCYNVKDIPA